MNKAILGFGELDLGKDWGITKLIIEDPNTGDPHITLKSESKQANLCLEEAKYFGSDNDKLSEEQLTLINDFMSKDHNSLIGGSTWFSAYSMWKMQIEDKSYGEIDMNVNQPNYTEVKFNGN